MRRTPLPRPVPGGIEEPGRAPAHHSFAAEFPCELFGTKEGDEEIRDAQTRAISVLPRSGWLSDTARFGDKLVPEGFPGLENSRKLWNLRC